MTWNLLHKKTVADWVRIEEEEIEEIIARLEKIKVELGTQYSTFNELLVVCKSLKGKDPGKKKGALIQQVKLRSEHFYKAFTHIANFMIGVEDQADLLKATEEVLKNVAVLIYNYRGTVYRVPFDTRKPFEITTKNCPGWGSYNKYTFFPGGNSFILQHEPGFNIQKEFLGNEIPRGKMPRSVEKIEFSHKYYIYALAKKRSLFLCLKPEERSFSIINFSR